MAAAREEGILEIVLSDAGEEINKTVKKYNTAVDFPALAETTPSERPWLEYGIGAAFATGKSSHLYFDVERSAGSDFTKDWQWNVGARWMF